MPDSPAATLEIPPFAMSDALLFVSTVVEGSFTAAAERHGITASGASRAITRLERSVGIRLLVRTTRRLRLTEEGEVFFKHCRDAIGLMAEAAELASESSASLRGQLRIGLMSILGTHLIVPLLPRLLSLHPQLSVQLVRVTTVAEFYSHRVDCALLPGDLMESTLAGRELRTGRMVVAASPSYIEKFGEPSHPADLLRHHCISLVQHDGQEFPWVFAAQDGADAPEPIRVRGRIRTDDMEQVIASALAGLGIAQVPYVPLVRAFESKQLIVLLEAHEMAGVPLWIVYPARRTVPRRVRAFVDFMTSTFVGEAMKTGN